MGEKLIVGPNINKGIKTDRLAFAIDNDSFPTLINSYQWRGRIKRKRGTSLLARLQRFFNSSSVSYNTGSTTITLGVGATGNLITGWSLNTAAPNATIVPGTVSIVDSTSGNTFTDPSSNGILVGAPAGSGTINYSTGAFTLTSGAAAADLATATFVYNPVLPVMGLEDLLLTPSQFPGSLDFDTVFSYNLPTTAPYAPYDVSFYKNPITATYPGFVTKTNVTPTSWNGQNYQQFWTTNYEGALWATNGTPIPFNASNIGMQFKRVTNVSMVVAGPPATARLAIATHGLVKGDFLFLNEFPIAVVQGINFQTCYVINVPDANNVDVELPNATLGGGGATSTGIAQYLTNRSDVTKDCLRWYDGDPTNGSSSSPTLTGNNGWVNFMPPLSQASYSISDLPALQYYLVGCRLMVPFKDRLVFFGPVIQASTGSPIYLQDTILFSQNGTPYYTCSYTNTPSAAADTPTSASNVFTAILVPTNQTATSPAYFEDQVGFGGFLNAAIQQPIVSVSNNEDVLIVGFGNKTQARMVYTGNDALPFNLFVINSELGTQSTFSTVSLDRGVISVGGRGIILTSQISSQRVDLDIPDDIFQFNLLNNGPERISAQRDFINEWIYFTYLSNEITYAFPNQTLQYNYREETWGLFNECYTTYGSFRKSTGYTWNTIGQRFPTWNAWNEPWNSGASTLLQPKVIAGNQQGFILTRDEGTAEGVSLSIQSFSGAIVTSPNHCLNNGDFIMISGCLGTIGWQVNSRIFQVTLATTNSFTLNPQITSGTYLGAGLITRLYVPQIQTKQFPTAWGIGRKTRLGPQQYLLTKTQNAQITLLIFLSQNADFPYNTGNIVPVDNSVNNSLIYSTVLYTCPESTNLGLTSANINLNMVTAQQQDEIWHRMNTSLLGDTVQIGFTISNDQMRSLTAVGTTFMITGATQAAPCVLTCANNLSVGQLVTISDVVGMIQLNVNTYVVTAVSPTTLTIGVDSTAFTAYGSGGIVTPVAYLNPTSEVELHSFILDLNPSQVLA